MNYSQLKKLSKITESLKETFKKLRSDSSYAGLFRTTNGEHTQFLIGLSNGRNGGAYFRYEPTTDYFWIYAEIGKSGSADMCVFHTSPDDSCWTWCDKREDEVPQVMNAIIESFRSRVVNSTVDKFNLAVAM